MGCREEILDAAYNITRIRNNKEFTISEIIDYMKLKGTTYKESTIRTQITSRCCKNAPRNHQVVYNDFERVGKGKYIVIK
ncbi:DUF7669 domain-containing protein [Ureibacillus acetophenoni]|uniref:DUF7669 domain-containing protein n=1 Tax=Ureibacillus acetophenoni TaxID=614649 RepID=A0A285UI60_9BACL|nr:hypothetical protein SAMN05877842_11074 [Ureibacillus acetophenoni]